MSKTGAAKVMTALGPVWCHYSQSENTTKLRRYLENAAYESVSDGDAILAFVPLDQCKKLAPADSYSFENAEVWSRILQSLESGVAPTTTEPTEPARRTPLVVPITELRCFYDVLKLLDKATWIGMANFYADTPKSLERLWNKSRQAFAGYDNQDDWGRGETEELPVAPTHLAAISSTDEFTAFIKVRPLDGYDFVEREINPWRTRSGEFSNKLPATKSGRGGMDLLLRSESTAFPVIGEVKVSDDKNAFFGLIQAMAYAVEMSTPSQLKRLKAHYPQAFGALDSDTARIEIALVLVNPVKDKSRKPVTSLIQQINKRGKCDGLGRITLLWNDGEEWSTLS